MDKEKVKSQDKNKTTSVVDDPQLDKLEKVEDNEPWKLEDEMTKADKEYLTRSNPLKFLQNNISRLQY